VILHLDEDGKGGTYSQTTDIKERDYSWDSVHPTGPDVVAGILARRVRCAFFSPSVYSDKRMLAGWGLRRS
jgi:hypothetical protein